MSSPTSRQPKSRDEYSIGWIVALSIELASAKAMLDEQHQEPADYQRPKTDNNSYTYGRIGENNIVIASLASGVYGNTMATTTALGMLASFPNIKFGLLVGIGAGIHSAANDIRLGDVAVSQPSGSSGGVFQYDLGKAGADGQWHRVDFLSRPPEALLKALSTLKSDHELQDAKMIYYLQQASLTHQKWGKNYARPDSAPDLLFQSSYYHSDGKKDCTECDHSQLVIRPPSDPTSPTIHYGSIASGNALVKDGLVRDKIAAMEASCICLEMEAAGLMNNFPCLVIRGICDYADSHKNDQWQRYASATAAAFAKELLSYISPREVDATAQAKSLVENTNDALTEIKKQWEQTNRDKAEEKRGAFLKSLAESTCDYGAGKNSNDPRIEGTCQWFINHEIFKSWQEGNESGLLWLSADPGCGKSVLSRYLVEDVLPVSKPSATICYFFFKNDSYQQSANRALCALLHQLFKHKLSALNEEILNDFHSQGSSFTQSLPILWNTLLSATSKTTDGEVICVLDSLHECQERDRRELIQKLSQFGLQSGSSSNLKFIVTSRPYRGISTGFQEVEQKFPDVHLRGDGDSESKEIAKEIDLVIDHRIKLMNEVKGLHETDGKILYEGLAGVPNWSYIWPQSVLDIIENSFDVGTELIQYVLSGLPPRLDYFYEQMIDQSPDHSLARKLFQIVLASRRPLSVREISIFLNISAAHRSYGDLARFLQSEDREDRMKANIRELSGLIVKIVDSKVYLIHQTAREFLLLQSERQDARPSLDRQFSRLSSFDKCISRTSSFASSFGRTNSPQTPLTRTSSYFSIPISEAKESFKTSKSFPRTNSLDKQQFLVPRKPSASSLASPPLLSPSTFAGNESTTTLGVQPEEMHSRWKKSIDLESSHTVLAEMCALWLDMSSGENPFPEIDRYCKTALFSHLYMAGTTTTSDQNKVVIDLLDHKLRAYWSLILRHMPNYEKDSIDYCPPPDDPSLINLLIYLGICPLVSTELVRSSGATTIANGVYPQLCLAAAKGDKQMLTLLSEYYNVNLKMKDDITPLHAAAQCGKLDAVRLLMDKGAFIEAKMKDGSRPLHMAVKYGRVAIVHFLLDRGADIEAKPGDHGLTPLNQAIQNGNVEMVKLLLDNEANFTTTQSNQMLPFHRAAAGKSIEILNTLFEMGVDIEVKNAQGSRALHFAAMNGRTANVEYLLDNLADINAVNGHSFSPVTSAIRGNQLETLKVLIGRSARCSLIDFLFAFQPMIHSEDAWQPRTEWNGSVNAGIISVLLNVVGSLPENDMQRLLCHEHLILDATSVSKILDAGAKVSMAVLIAALKRDTEYQKYRKWAHIGSNVVETILERFETDFVGASDRMRLTSVALKDQPPARVLQLLHQNLIQVTELDRQERGKPFLFSAMEGDFHFVESLLDALVTVDEQDESGRTALSYAFAYGMRTRSDAKASLSNDRRQEYMAIAELLLQRGADADRPDNDGQTPLQWAEMAGNDSAEQLVDFYRLEISSSSDAPQMKIKDEDEVSMSESQTTVQKSQKVMRTTKEVGQKVGKMGKEVGKEVGKTAKEVGGRMGKGIGKMSNVLKISKTSKTSLESK